MHETEKLRVRLHQIFDLSSPLVLEGRSSAMKQAGYAVMVSYSMEDHVIEEAAIEQLLGHRIDGLSLRPATSLQPSSSNSKSRGFHLF